ncbi:MAG TPA: RNA polymerase subunit sigma-70 [Bacteroidales bacterium]|jgi:RNA polymerase sigma-70 factor (ECF subfamily)|nr:RNA polymerase subunit sigma-70 [Bacteroidales bacterium]
MTNKDQQFRKVIHDNEQRISSICKYYSSNEEDHKDMFQEVLINIWKSMDSFRGDAQMSTWIYRVAVNTAMGFSNKEIRRQKIFLNDKENSLQNFIDVDENVAKEKEKLFQRLDNEINQLSVIDKIIMTLVLEGINHKEISDIIGITEPNVRVKIHRIKNELKETLKLSNY